MQKRIISDHRPSNAAIPSSWLNLEELADVEITSENPDFPVEGALLPRFGQGWRAADPGMQTIRLLFTEPQTIHHFHLSFHEASATRTQEYALRYSQDNGQSYLDIVRQQWNFSPEGSHVESDDHKVNLSGVNIIELDITPDISGQLHLASLAKLRIA
ncbi:MAG: carbohydrate-binding protein [Methylococcaceae bacterium]|nr:carbohydrate-binding protein [Methylococcaceae bacterium]